MDKKIYLTLSILGMFLVIIPVMTTGGALTLLTGILMGVGLSMSAVSTYKLLVNFGGKTEA